MKNYEGEEISDEKVKEIEERVSKLSKENIDELFYRAGFIITKSQVDSNKSKEYQRVDNKALSPHQLQKIKENDSAVVEHLLRETPLDVVLTNLEELEKRK